MSGGEALLAAVRVWCGSAVGRRWWRGGRCRMEVAIGPANDLSAAALAPLVAESEAEGWRFVRRLADDRAAGRAGFDGPGETLFGAWSGAELVGVCGLTADPYTPAAGVGRVRRLYVPPTYRGRGIGGRLVRAVVTAAAGHFDTLRVRTESPAAGRVYERLGFVPAEGEAACTHILRLVPSTSS